MERRSGATLALAGALSGLAAAVFLATLRFVLVGDEPGPSTAVQEAAFGVLYIAPFVLSLCMFAVSSTRIRAAVWQGAALLGFVLSFSAFSGVSLLLLPASLLLMIGSTRALADGQRRSVGIAGFVVIVGIALVGLSAFTLFLSSYESVCWQATIQGGERVWEMQRPVSGSQMGTSSPDGYCTTGWVSVSNALSAAGIWLIGAPAVVLAGMMLDRRDRGPTSGQTIGVG